MTALEQKLLNALKDAQFAIVHKLNGSGTCCEELRQIDALIEEVEN